MLLGYTLVCRSSTSGRKKVSRVVLRDCSKAKRRRRLSMGMSATEHSRQELPKNRGGEGLIPPKEEEEEGRVLHVLKRQETWGSAASAESRYTSWGCSREGVMARWRQSRLMCWTRATSVSKDHLRQAFWACLASRQAHLGGRGGGGGGLRGRRPPPTRLQVSPTAACCPTFQNGGHNRRTEWLATRYGCPALLGQ